MLENCNNENILCDKNCLAVFVVFFHFLHYLICSNNSTSAMSQRKQSSPIKISEIPPFRRNTGNPPTTSSAPGASSVSTTSSAGASPFIAEIPAFKPRKSNDWVPSPASTEADYQLQVPSGVNPEWIRRIKGTDSSVIHRSVDCIPKVKVIS